MNLAKSLIGPKKTFSIIAHLYAVKWQFWAEIPSDPYKDRFDTQRTKHAFRLCLRNRTTAHTEYAMGCTVNNLLKL
jgi:hypothetical protein